jgi:Beta-galactosidase
MAMLSPLRLVALALVCGLLPSALFAQRYSSVVIWLEADLPTADSAAPSSAQLAQSLPGARFVSADQLATHLGDPQTQLFVLPQGSVVPEAAWSAIEQYLQRGGNLLVLGGRPFTRAAFHDGSGWHLRDYSVRFSRLLGIDQYQSTPGSSGAQFTPNSEIPIELPHFAWKQAFSPIIRLSSSSLYNRGGSAGSLDARLVTLAWGVSNGRRLSAPLLEVDHLSGPFANGRWIFLAAELAPDFYAASDSATLLRTLADRALCGGEEFTVRPALPLYLSGEPIEVETVHQSAAKPSGALTVDISEYPEDQPAQKSTITLILPATSPVLLPPPKSKGLHIIEARLLEGNTLRAIYHSAFWIRDEQSLRSGPRLGVNADYFTIDDKPLAVVGTTYMSSEVQRLYFDHPNVYIWKRDLSQIHDAGLNMIRSGWWTGWDKLCDESGRPYERTLRTLEAYLMTAHKYGLPVQFNLFAFLPEVLGGSSPYLDPVALRRQHTLVQTLAVRFHDVPYLAWDLINEPSFSKYLWKMLPNGDPIELAAWNAWLAKKYPDRAALAAAWNVPPDTLAGTISLPSEEEFDPRGTYVGVNSLRVYDFVQFAQDTFADWVRAMREIIRASGSSQPITVGQDEGGYQDRLSPAFFAPYVDFTSNHSWWLNDHLLWDSLVAKQPGKAMLIQETGLQRELNLDEIARRTPEQEAALFERKFAMSFVFGSGAIEWLWNSNSYMTESNETPIGALHTDLTEKPEATVLRDMAKFAAAASPYLKNPKPPQIVVVTSQAAQFSVYAQLQLAAQQNAVRALGYDLHQPCSILAENQIDKLGSPKLVILPSAQALRESTWQVLLAYVKSGGNLLVTGPVSRDEHWQPIDRLTPLGLTAGIEPLTMHYASLNVDSADERNVRNIQDDIPLSFSQPTQQSLEYLRFDSDSTLRELRLEKGKLFWVAFPVELSEDNSALAKLYEKILGRPASHFSEAMPGRIQIRSTFSVASSKQQPIPSLSFSPNNPLVYSIELEDAVLYVLESESDQDADLDLHDYTTSSDLKLQLPAQHAALAIIDKHSKRIVAKYGLP